MFCVCETCDSKWEDIRDVLRKGKVPVSNETLEYIKDHDEITRELLIRALIPPSNIKIAHFKDATRDEIIAAGWDKYDDVYCIVD